MIPFYFVDKNLSYLLIDIHLYVWNAWKEDRMEKI